MSNEVITHKHEWVRGLFSELDRIAKDAATMADENQPLLGGEHYLTDRELSERLKISRAPCKTIATTVFCHTVNWVEKSSIVKAILSEYCKVVIVASFRLYPIGCNMYPKIIKLYPMGCNLKNFHYICTR